MNSEDAWSLGLALVIAASLVAGAGIVSLIWIAASAV